VITVLYLSLGEQAGTVRGFQAAGVNLHVFDFWTASNTKGKEHANKTFVEMVSQTKPDLVHMQLQMTGVIDPATIAQARGVCPKAIFTNWTGDIRKQANQYFLSISKMVDYSLLSNVGQIDLYRNSGCHNPVYWQIGYCPEITKPLWKDDFKYKIAFVANHYSHNLFPDAGLRQNIMTALRTQFGSAAGLFGTGFGASLKISSIDMSKVNDLYNDSLTVLSVSNFNDVSHYFSDRLLMCVGSGRPAIIYRFPGIESYFANKGDVLVANSMDEVISLVNTCEKDREFARAVGRNGHMKMLAEHTFTSRIYELLYMTGLSGK